MCFAFVKAVTCNLQLSKCDINLNTNHMIEWSRVALIRAQTKTWKMSLPWLLSWCFKWCEEMSVTRLNNRWVKGNLRSKHCYTQCHCASHGTGQLDQHSHYFSFHCFGERIDRRLSFGSEHEMFFFFFLSVCRTWESIQLYYSQYSQPGNWTPWVLPIWQVMLGAITPHCILSLKHAAVARTHRPTDFPKAPPTPCFQGSPHIFVTLIFQGFV